MRKPFRCYLAVIWVIALTLVAAVPYAEDATPYPRITEEAFKARLPFFDYDTKLSLDGRVVQQWKEGDTVRDKIVFRGAQGFLVPGYFEVPNKAQKPYPLVLLLHGWSGSKEVWYKDGGIHSGGEMRKALLGEGYAVLALDAATHGERSNEIGYQHVNAFDDPKAPPSHNYFTYAEISVQTVKDYRRALDFMAERGDVDMNRIGLVGYSMGGMDSFYLLSVEPRIKMAVACVPPLTSPGYGAANPIDYSWGIGSKPFCMLMGRKDEMGDPVKVEASYHQYIETPNTKLIWYDKGHGLTEIYVPDALAWVKTHL
ncbi:MAG: alpha/beta fold hydrolase [Candidatus Hydrogenedentes bacterium]|nr:alpha/beta fold hydrolase [Candidatus Hydrogenedentota bacterium]